MTLSFPQPVIIDIRPKTHAVQCSRNSSGCTTASDKSDLPDLPGGILVDRKFISGRSAPFPRLVVKVQWTVPRRESRERNCRGAKLLQTAAGQAMRLGMTNTA